MGRSPCCSKVGLNRGVWTSAEDKILTDYIQLHGEGRWRNLPKRAGLLRCGKSCRLRWLNYLRPDIKRGNISDDEQDLIIRLHKLLGNRWSLIAGRLPGRTDNEIKNYWNTILSKKVRDNHTTFVSSAPKKSTKRNNIKKKDKVKRQSAQDNVDSHLADQPPFQKCTEPNNSLKPDEGLTNVLEPNLPSTFDMKVESHEDKMYTYHTPPDIFRDTVSASTKETLPEPNNDNDQQTLNYLEPHIDLSDICLPELLCPDFSTLFGSDNHSRHAENEIITALASSDDNSIMEMLEELWSPHELHISSTSDCTGDWLV